MDIANNLGRICILALFLLFGVGLIEAVIGPIGDWKYLYQAIVITVWLYWDAKKGNEEAL
ncbi:hypothetical protein [Microbulbifer epialgicus]|uniref:TMhelix containing protein n=1 Tax=Microbulbifer epialgicus TaxID=393907 RepID=A0ABV4NTQ7_9GAMM